MARFRGTAPPRQGVILLIVVILLTLFLVVGLSFVLYAESEATASRIYRESQTVIDDKADEDATVLMNYALNQLVYDVRDDGEDLYSALRGHSLARLTYGWNYQYSSGTTFNPASYAAPNATLNQIPFNGIGALRVMSFPASATTLSAGQRNAFSAVREDQLVNYTSFSQTDGFVRDPERIGVRAASTSPTSNRYAGGANVPYTFPDRNNMFLAALKGDGNATPWVMLPSFFRPIELPGGTTMTDFSYGTNYSTPDPRLRFWLDHPNAPSSSAFRNPASGPYKYMSLRPRPADMYYNYNDPTDPHNFPLPNDPGGDVQNLSGARAFRYNANGQSDSFWMDLNYKVLTARNGKKYKPLFAFLVVDMEGRLNVNVHGNVRGSDGGSPPRAIHASNQGVGKHEVNLGKVLDASADPSEWQRLFDLQVGKYASDQVPASTLDQYPALPQEALHSFIARVDFDAIDDTQQNQVTRKFNVPLTQYRLFPDFASKPGYEDLLNAAARAKNPLLYNALSPRASDAPFSLGENVQYMHGSASGTNHMRAALYRLMPKNMDTSRRFQVTTHSYDLDVPGMSASLDGAVYDLQDNALYPKGTALSFDAQLSAILNPKPVSDAFWQFTNGTASTPQPPARDGRVPLLSRIDMNRPLTSYYLPGTHTVVAPTTLSAAPTLPNDRFHIARNDRQAFASDIFHRLVQATGANLAATPSDPQAYNALRYLAQLAANIVDYIDDDDISTAFDWVAAKNLVRRDGFTSPYSTNPADYVFGTEAPRVLLNELYAEMRNKSGDDDLTQGAQQSFQVNIFAELFNPLPETGDTSLGFLNNRDRHTAVLQSVGQQQGAYRIDVYNSATAATDLRKADNVTGTLTSPKCSLTTFTGTPANVTPAPAVPLDVTVIQPNDGTQQCVQGYNKGFYVVGPNADLASGSLTPTLKADNGQLTFDVSNAVTPPSQAPLTVVLRRLANPHLAPNPLDPATSAINPALPYNPYIVVDFQSNVTVHDAVKVGKNPNPVVPLTPRPEFSANKATTGRAHPMAATQVGNQSGNGSTPANTFFQHNSNANSGQFDWFIHLNRPLINAMEVLQVSGFKPLELTHQFVDQTGNKFQHRAPWTTDPDARIYRALEFFTVGERNLPGTGGTSTVPANALISSGGRKAGMININTIWDKKILEAICDAQQNSNNFTATDVDSVWNAIQNRRSSNLGGTGTVDKPFVGLAAPHVRPGDPQFDPANGTAGANGGYAASTLKTQNQTHPFLTDEILTKIAGHLTTRSNLFEVYLTVGFFEVIDDTTRPVKLGAEIRARDGSFIRHKMFAVVDRTNIGMDEPATVTTLDANLFKQSPNRPVYLTSSGAIPAGSTQLTLTFVPDKYDPAYDPTSMDATFWSNVKVIYVDTGVRRERIPVSGAILNSATVPNQLTFAFAAATQYDHPAGTTVTTTRGGNPGPQTGFSVSDTRYKYVVPYSKVVE
ncbi:MAG: hypothetical protein U0746_11210 [Gemmataceae bacterium]